MTLLQATSAQSLFSTHGMVLKDWLPFVTVVTTVTLFLIDRLIAIGVRRREAERSWYLKVLIEPNINKITEFYDAVETAFAESTAILAGAEELSFNKYVGLKAQASGKFAILKRRLEQKLIAPLQPNYPNISESLTNNLLALQDDFTGSLDNRLFSEEEIQNFSLRASASKANLLNILYLPLARKKYWLWRSFIWLWQLLPNRRSNK